MNVSGSKLISDDLMSKKVVTDPHSYYYRKVWNKLIDKVIGVE